MSAMMEVVVVYTLVRTRKVPMCVCVLVATKLDKMDSPVKVKYAHTCVRMCVGIIWRNFTYSSYFQFLSYCMYCMYICV